MERFVAYVPRAWFEKNFRDSGAEVNEGIFNFFTMGSCFPYSNDLELKSFSTQSQFHISIINT